MKKRILFIFGTRPEVIKLAPVIKEFKNYPDTFEVIACNTGQHTEMSRQALSYFDLSEDINLNIMEHNQTLSLVNIKAISGLQEIMQKEPFHAVIGQGDTMTTFSAALTAFYNKIPFFHVEAGLRSYNVQEPFPEELLRQCISRIATLHFAPTELSKQALLQEMISKEKIYITGNTVVDALLDLKDKPLNWSDSDLSGVDPKSKIILVTVHRRENHGENLESILKAITLLSAKFSEFTFVLPVHPNPNVTKKVKKVLGNLSNVVLTSPLGYLELIKLMSISKLILTDSGGIQEEAPTFGVLTLVLRNVTERMEGIHAGCAKLVGTNTDNIVNEAILALKSEPNKVANFNPYGDGKASQRICQVIKSYYSSVISVDKL